MNSNNSKNSGSVTIISWLQKIALYETKARLYVIGSNNTETKFRVLKIDRTEPKELNVIDDKVEYTQQEIRDMLTMIDVGNRHHKSSVSGFNRTISAFGIVGFIRFLEGYYLILITKRRRVAQIGCHAIYKIEDTTMIYIPNEFDKSNHDEAKYYKMFQNVDLSSNFYFSYSYDLTRTLQYNMTPCFLQKQSDNDKSTFNLSESKTVWEMASQSISSVANTEPHCGGVRTKPNFKFVWNEHLLKSIDLHPDWMLYICHGFVGQNNISVFGRPIYLTLIAKRSQKYAGTRFLKRGANCDGDVANEVETEQIVHDSSVSSFQYGFYTSFVQMRGSIPSHWSQDISKMVPKPTIAVDIVDPFCEAASRHFNQLLYRYGSPVIVLNLVKRKEQKPHESVLSNEFINTVAYLNQFLPPKYQIDYIGFDMARFNKLKEANVMSRLSEIAYYTLKSTGIFQSKDTCLNRSGATRTYLRRDKRFCGGYRTQFGSILQTGLVRVNCVDCLDRTNTAQFALGKVALAFQLYALGVIEKPELEFETDTVRMLEELYEDHGDTLALQYGGSQLVHRIKTYRKIAPLSSHSRDIMQTLSRYYSNAFSDADKQNVMNLFLGVYEPNKSLPIWDLYTDFYLHHSFANTMFGENTIKKYTHWWSDEVANCLPRAAVEINKGKANSLMCLSKDCFLDERTDGFYEQYKPYELTVFTDTLAFNIVHTCKDLMPNFTADYSPFSVRLRPGKRRESMMGASGSKLPPPNPSVSGHTSTSSTSSDASELESDSDEEVDNNDTILNVCNNNTDDTEDSSCSHESPFRVDAILANSEQKYGTLIKTPQQTDLQLYSNYVNIGVIAGEIKNSNLNNNFNEKFKLPNNIRHENDDCRAVRPPIVSKESLNIYKEYIKIGKEGVSNISSKSLDIYKNYINSCKLNN